MTPIEHHMQMAQVRFHSNFLKITVHLLVVKKTETLLQKLENAIMKNIYLFCIYEIELDVTSEKYLFILHIWNILKKGMWKGDIMKYITSLKWTAIK